MWMKQFYLCHKSILSPSCFLASACLLAPMQPLATSENTEYEKKKRTLPSPCESHIWLDQFTSGKIINDFRASNSKWLMLKERHTHALFVSHGSTISFSAALLPSFQPIVGNFYNELCDFDQLCSSISICQRLIVVF